MDKIKTDMQNDYLLDIPSFIKRPDLRPDEFPQKATIEEETEVWKLLVSDLALHEELLSKGEDPLEAICCLGLAIYPEIHGDIPHPVDIISFFCACHEWGVYPPPWVMNELYHRFNKYILGNQTGQDKRRLGEYFGEPSRGNQSPYFRQKVFAGVMESACIAVDRLRFIHQLTRENAIAIAASRLENVHNNTSHKFDKGEAALEKKYKIWHSSC